MKDHPTGIPQSHLYRLTTLLLMLALSLAQALGQTPYTPPDLFGETTGQAQAFWRNAGQLLYSDDSTPASAVRYYTRGQQPGLYCLDQSIAMIYREARQGDHDTVWHDHYRIDLSFPGEGGATALHPLEPTGVHMNVYKTNLPQPVENAGSYGRLVYENVFPDVDFHLLGNQVFNKMALVLHPGADPDKVKLRFDGQDVLNVLPNQQEVELYLAGRDIRIPQATAYQVNGQGFITPLLWTPTYTHLGNGTVDLGFGTYDNTQELVLLFGAPQASFFASRNRVAETPPAWLTYFGGRSTEAGQDITTDDVGNVYATGWMQSDGLNQLGATIEPQKDGKDVFVVKFDNEYKLNWITFIGSNLWEEGTGIAWTGAQNRLHVVGSAFQGQFYLLDDFSALYNPIGQPNSGFWARFDAGNGILRHSTFLGGDNSPALSVAADPVTGDFVIGGRTDDLSGWDPDPWLTLIPRIPVVNNSPAANPYFQIENAQNLVDTAAPGFINTNTNRFDGWFTIFNPNGTVRLSSFFGGDGYDAVNDVALDPIRKKIYLTGTTYSYEPDTNYYCTTDTHLFKLCPGSPSAYFRERLNTAPPSDYHYSDGFIARLSYDGELEWSTYLGGQHTDAITSVAVNGLGEVGVTGYTDSWDTVVTPCGTGLTRAFPTCHTAGQYTGGYGGDYDVFFTVFDTVGAMTYSVLTGGSGRESIREMWGFNQPPHLQGEFPHLATDFDHRFWLHFTSLSPHTIGWPGITVPTLEAPSFYWQEENAELAAAPSNNASLGKSDAFVMAIDEQRQLKVATHLGGTGSGTLDGVLLGDWAGGIATFGDAVYVTGGTYSTDHFGPYCPPGAWCQGDTTVTVTSSSTNFHHSAVYFGQLNEKLWPVHVPEVQRTPSLAPLRAFPNPASTAITVSVPEPGLLRLTDSSGKTVIQQRVGVGTCTLQLDQLAGGAYWLSLETGSEHSYTGQIVVIP